MRPAALLFLLAAACAPSGGNPGGAPAEGSRAAVVRVGSPRPDTDLPVLFVEVAATPSARERGLAGRSALAPDRGMLFVYPDRRNRRFWMKGCAVGLDIAFLEDDGRVVRLATLPPGLGLSGAEIPAVDCPEPVSRVLEASQGWFAAHGIGTGDRVDVSVALRGVVPK